MNGVDLAYTLPAGCAGMVPTVSIFADCPLRRDGMVAEAHAAGFDIAEAVPLASLCEGKLRVLGDAVLIDSPSPDATALAALSRIDTRAIRSGAHLLVATDLAGLEDVFACLSLSDAEILVDPRPSEWLVALGRIAGLMLGWQGTARVRELSETDRMALLRLAEQVNRIAAQMDRLGAASDAGSTQGQAPAFRFDSHGSVTEAAHATTIGDRLIHGQRPPLPDPRMVRRIIQQRQLRARFFDASLFADPAWDMLLDLTAARAEHARVSVTSLCIASGVPATTALRWISQMIQAGLFERTQDETDRRRAFIQLTDKAADGMARYFALLGRDTGLLV